jgi:hypothetical protein
MAPAGNIETTWVELVRHRVPGYAAAGTLLLAYVLLWYLVRGNSGIYHDGQLYAFQALSRLNNVFATHDLFLAYGSQDRYTIFTGIYAWFIERLGLETAQVFLHSFCQLSFVLAAASIVRHFTSTKMTWLISGVVLVVPGPYGGLDVFEYAEPFLTARSAAEPLALIAISCALRHRWTAAVAAAGLALLFHPIMAAPALIMICWLALPRAWWRTCLVLGTAAIGTIVTISPHLSAGPFSPIDTEWLAIIKARSPFMFVDSWFHWDWDWIALSFLTLGFFLRYSRSSEERAFAYAAALVGSVGLGMAALVTFHIPITIIVQGQPWRWMWICTLAAVLLMPLALARAWQESLLHRSGALLLATAWLLRLTWVFPELLASAFAAAALACIAFSKSLPEPLPRHVFLATVVVSATVILSTTPSILAAFRSQPATGMEPSTLQVLRKLFQLGLPALAVALVAWFLTVRTRLLFGTAMVFVLATTGLTMAAPVVQSEWTTSLYSKHRDAFAAWRQKIDGQRSVLWIDDPTLSWFLLDAPSYISIGQTAGLAFSRDAAVEAKRRSEVLRPLGGKGWLGISVQLKDLLHIEPNDTTFRSICTDRALGYVVMKTKLSIAPLATMTTGKFAGLSLYGCNQVAR